MKTTMIIIALLAFGSSAFGQKTYFWKGGKPGRVNDWNCAANWSTNRVPDEFADVIIPQKQDVSDYPVINAPGAEINSMRICEGARVTIGMNGSLRIINLDYCDDISRIVVIGTLHVPKSVDKVSGGDILASRNLH